MRTILLALVLLGLPLSSLANLNSFSSLSLNQLVEQLGDGDWYLCDQSGKRYCLDEFYYYNHAFYAELLNNTQESELYLISPFSVHVLTQVQRYLRQDGFRLAHVQIEQQTMDVELALANAKDEQEINQLDKALVLFLNRYAQDALRVMRWRKDQAEIILRSDGELIELTYKL